MLLFTHGEPLGRSADSALRRFLNLPVGKPAFGDMA
jgi:hypothetical protein